MAAIALASGGCIATFGGGGNWQRGNPDEPNPAGGHLRLGGGGGVGNRHGWVAGAVEYRRVGDFNSAGLAVESGLFLFQLPPSRRQSSENFVRLYGRSLGDGITLRGRFAVGGWGPEPDPIVYEGGIGLGFDATHDESGPGGLALYFSVFRAAHGEDDTLWSYGINVGGALPLDELWDKLP